MSEYTTAHQSNASYEGDTPPQEVPTPPSTPNRFITATHTLEAFLACKIEQPMSLLGEVFPEGALGCSTGSLAWARHGWG